MKDLTWLFFDNSLQTSGFNLDEMAHPPSALDASTA